MSESKTVQGFEDEAGFGEYVSLLKPRVMSLVVFTAAVGLLVAPARIDPVLAFASILFIALGAGASGALNMWWDADIDEKMRRTASRPVPAGRISAETARDLGIALSLISVGMLALSANLLAAALLAFTIFFYAVIYTMWLKRWTPQNIVIGGASGALPPMIGWAAATGNISVESVLMFLLIFMWTPPHFWALSLFMNDDYSRAGVPMLTVTHGRKTTRRHIFAYTLLLVPVSLALAFTPIGGPAYLATAVVLNAVFVLGAWRVLNRSEEEAAADGYAVEKRFFRLSLLYLFVHFVALLVEKVFRVAGVEPGDWPVLFGGTLVSGLI